MTTTDALAVVEKLNDEIYDRLGEEGPEDIYLTLDTNGLGTNILFCGYPIWDSESDERAYTSEENDAEQEPLEEFLRRTIGEFIDRLNILCLGRTGFAVEGLAKMCSALKLNGGHDPSLALTNIHALIDRLKEGQDQ